MRWQQRLSCVWLGDAVRDETASKDRPAAAKRLIFILTSILMATQEGVLCRFASCSLVERCATKVNQSIFQRKTR